MVKNWVVGSDWSVHCGSLVFAGYKLGQKEEQNKLPHPAPPLLPLLHQFQSISRDFSS